MSNRPRIIVLEGADNVGKTTATRILAAHLSNLGYYPYFYNLPGGSQVGDIIRNNIWKDHNVTVKNKNSTSVYLMLACLSEIQATMHERDKGEHGVSAVHILDRWIYSIMVYHKNNKIIDNVPLSHIYFKHPDIPVADWIIGLTRDIPNADKIYDLNDKQEKEFINNNLAKQHINNFNALFNDFVPDVPSIFTSSKNSIYDPFFDLVENNNDIQDLEYKLNSLVKKYFPVNTYL